MASHRRLASNVDRGDARIAAHLRDDRILGVILLVLSAPRVVMGLVTHETFGAESTVAAMATCLGVLLMIATRRR